MPPPTEAAKEAKGKRSSRRSESLTLAQSIAPIQDSEVKEIFYIF